MTGNTNERPIKVPEARYQCAGEYCPQPGYQHRSNSLYLHTEMNRPGFFCSTCRPTPFRLDLPGNPPEEITLEQYLSTKNDQHETTFPSTESQRRML